MFFASRLSHLKGRGRYHIQQCVYFKNIQDKNIVLIRDEKEAKEKGYSICSSCCKLIEKKKLLEKKKRAKSFIESKLKNDESILDKYSGRYKYSYKDLGLYVIISTRYSEWYYKKELNTYKLYHKNSFSKGSGKWGSEFHTQSQCSRFSSLSALLRYIYNHDLRKYKKTVTKAERIGKLLKKVFSNQ